MHFTTTVYNPINQRVNLTIRCKLSISKNNLVKNKDEIIFKKDASNKTLMFRRTLTKESLQSSQSFMNVNSSEILVRTTSSKRCFTCKHLYVAIDVQKVFSFLALI